MKIEHSTSEDICKTFLTHKYKIQINQVPESVTDKMLSFTTPLVRNLDKKETATL